LQTRRLERREPRIGGSRRRPSRPPVGRPSGLAPGSVGESGRSVDGRSDEPLRRRRRVEPAPGSGPTRATGRYRCRLAVPDRRQRRAFARGRTDREGGRGRRREPIPRRRCDARHRSHPIRNETVPVRRSVSDSSELPLTPRRRGETVPCRTQDRERTVRPSEGAFGRTTDRRGGRGQTFEAVEARVVSRPALECLTRLRPVGRTHVDPERSPSVPSPAARTRSRLGADGEPVPRPSLAAERSLASRAFRR
jgi:hypothetical protein